MLGSVFNRQRQASGQAPLQCNLRTFHKLKQLYGFSEFLGTGPPALDYGLPGDIYLDLSPENMTLYARLENAWEPWRGPDDTTNLVCHPEHRDRCLWCNGETYGWVSTRGRLGSQGQGKTQSQLLAAAEEKAKAKEGPGRKRKFSQDGEQRNKRVQISASTTPPPASITQITSPTLTQRRPSTSHPVPPASLQRTDNQLQSPQIPSSNTMGSSLLRRRTDSPHVPIPSAAPRQASIAHRAGSPPPRAAAVAGPSRTFETAVAGPSRISDIDTAPPEILVDSAEEIDELDETEGDPHEIDQLLDSDAPQAPADLARSQHSDTTPPLDTALAYLMDLESEQHYFPSAIAAYLKPVLLELACLRQDVRERDAAARQAEAEAGLAHTESTPPLDTALSRLSNLGNEQHYSASAIATYLKPVLQELARLRHAEREHDAAAAETRRQGEAVRAALARAQEVSSAYAARLAVAQAEVATLKDTAQLAEGRVTAGETAHSQLRALATRDAELLAQRTRELEALQASAGAAAASAKTANEELARLRDTAAADAWRIEENGKKVQALERAAEVQNAAFLAAREEVERLKGDAATAAERREAADDEIDCWRAAAAASGERVAVLEAENARLKAVEDRCERAEAARREARAQLRAAQAEIGRLRVENAGLREEVAVADVLRLREGTVTPRKPSRAIPPGQSTSRDAAATPTPTPRRRREAATPARRPPQETPPRQGSTATPQPPDRAPSVDMLQDIHVDIICATVNDFAVCRFCLGSDPEVITTFERRAIRDIHSHNMQVHRAEYSQFMFDTSQDLQNLRQLVSRAADE